MIWWMLKAKPPGWMVMYKNRRKEWGYPTFTSTGEFVDPGFLVAINSIISDPPEGGNLIYNLQYQYVMI